VLLAGRIARIREFAHGAATYAWQPCSTSVRATILLHVQHEFAVDDNAERA